MCRLRVLQIPIALRLPREDEPATVPFVLALVAAAAPGSTAHHNLYGVQKPRGVDISPAEELPEW